MKDEAVTYAPGRLVPPAAPWAELSRTVVFVPLGYGPTLAAELARRALVVGERTAAPGTGAG